MRIALILLLLVSTAAFATNKEREQRWIDQTVDAIFDGEAIYLDADDHRFLGIYTESQTDSARGMIVIHGTGLHPNWEQVIKPLRVDMTAFGWNTLSIQMPILHSEAQYEDYVSLYPEIPARINAAAKYLQAQGSDSISIVAHSQGATMACYYLANTDHNIRSLVAIGMSAQHTQPHINSANSLAAINIPVLDIYGSKDFAAVLATVDKRRESGSHNENYTQVVIPQAYHFFDQYQKELTDVVGNWLDKVN